MADLKETDVEKARLMPRGGSSKLARNFDQRRRKGDLKWSADEGKNQQAGRVLRYLGNRHNGGPSYWRRTTGGGGRATRTGVYKSTDATDVVDAFYAEVEKARGLMRLSTKRNTFRAGSGTHGAMQSLRRMSGQTKRQARSLGKRINSLGGLGDKRDLRNKLSDVEHRRGRVATAISYLRRRSKRNLLRGGLGYDHR